MMPEIYEMQVRAIVTAACQLTQEGLDIAPEIMIPMVSHVNELKWLRPRLRVTKIRLAKLIIRQGEDFADANQLLDEARKIMRQHKVSPQSVFDEIDALAKSVDKRQSELASSSLSASVFSRPICRWRAA